MDGNKKIKGIVFAGIISLAITACKVQPTGYVSLYVDNLRSANNTIEPGEIPLNMMEDIAFPHLIDTRVINEQELPDIFIPAKNLVEISSDRIYQQEVNELLKSITDTIQRMRQQITELQNQHVFKIDTNFLGKGIHKDQPLDSLPPEVDLKQLVQLKNDTISMLGSQETELKKTNGLRTDIVYINNEKIQHYRDSLQPYLTTTQLLLSKNDTIDSQPKQVYELQNNNRIKSDTIDVTEETEKLSAAESRRSDTTILQLLQAKNDTIHFLQSQLQNIQLQPQKRDTVYIEKESEEIQPVEESDDKQKATDLQILQDSIGLLKTRVRSLEEQILPGKETPNIVIQDEKAAPYNSIKDTTLLLLAFYEEGEIIPLEEETILKQIKEFILNKNVTDITLSGYTDSSESETINNEMTNLRLNYLSEKITPWIVKEKIIFQHFGDVFSSDMLESDEYRIEIRIHSK